MTANALTKKILTFLGFNGFNVWRQNNLAVRGRKFIGKKGVPDVIGFCNQTGLFIGVEVKVGADKLSEEQIELHDSMTEAGALVFVASDFEQFVSEFKTVQQARKINPYCEGCNKTICNEPCDESNGFNLPM